MIKNSSVAQLITIQGLGYLVPIITVPFLIKKMGIESFGKLAYFTAFFQYFILIIEYGFSTSATMSVSRMTNNNKWSGKVFWNVTILKITITIILLLITTLAIMSIESLQADWKIILSSFTSTLIGILVPTWLFIGKDKAYYINTITLAGKISSIPLLFLLISGPDDIWLAALLQNTTICIAGIYSIIYGYKNGWIPFSGLKLTTMLMLAKDGWHIFITNLSINFYTHSVTVILGANSGTTAVGLFTAADRVRQAFQGLLIPVSQVYLHKINALIKKDHLSAKIAVRQATIAQAAYGAALSLILFLSAEIISTALFKVNHVEIAEYIRLASPLPFIIAISNSTCTLALTSFGMKKSVSLIILLSGSISIPLSYILTNSMKVEGAFIAIVITEIMVTVLSARECYKRKLML